MSSTTYRTTYPVRTYDIDAQKRMTVPALVRLMQEAAMEHVMQLRFSVWDLEPEQLGWVLLRKQLHIDRLPVMGETITIETTPTGYESVFTFRDYHVTDQAGRTIAHSGTRWMLMHLGTRRPARLPLRIRDSVVLQPAAAPLPRPGRDLLPQPDESATERHHRVGYHELDFNQHLNNTVYLQWMLDGAPAPLLQHARLQHIDIAYHHEARLGDRIVSRTQKIDATTYHHQLLLEADATELARGVTRWSG